MTPLPASTARAAANLLATGWRTSDYFGSVNPPLGHHLGATQCRAIGEVKASEVRAFAGGIEGTAKHVRNLLTPLRATFADALNDDLITVDPDAAMVFRTYGKFMAQDYQKPKVARLRIVGGS